MFRPRLVGLRLLHRLQSKLVLPPKHRLVPMQVHPSLVLLLSPTATHQMTSVPLALAIIPLALAIIRTR